MNQLYSLHEYLEFARKCSSMFFRGRFNDDDLAIGQTASAVMKAHVNWRPDGGSKLNTHLMEHAKYEMKKIHHKNKTYRKQLSDISQESDAFIDGAKSSESRYDDREFCEHILQTPTLLDVEKEYLRAYYFEGRTMADIAKEKGVVRATVSHFVVRGRNKIRKYWNENGQRVVDGKSGPCYL